MTKSDTLKLVIFGGVRFAGRAIVAALAARGHRLLIVHRKDRGCHPTGSVRHLHLARTDVVGLTAAVREFAPEGVVDVDAMTAADVANIGSVFEPGLRVVVLSSCDVYEAYRAYREHRLFDQADITEASPLRPVRRVFRTSVPGAPLYDKLDVEAGWRRYAPAVLRSTAIFGPHDYLRRESFVIDRVAAGRRRIPFGIGNHRYTKLAVADLATSVVACLERERFPHGEIFNIAQNEAPTARDWATMIASALDTEVEYVRVQDDLLPPDLLLSAGHPQQLVISSRRAQRLLAWQPAALADRVRESVEWHRSNPPDRRRDFVADDRALIGGDR